MEITTLKEPGLHPDTCQLLKPKKATKQQVQVLRDFVDGPLNEAMVASSAKLAKGGTIHAHDVVVFQQQDGRWEVGQVWFHLEVGAQQVTLLQRWTPTVNKASHSAKCTIANEQGFVPIDSIQYPLPSDQEATVLIPYQLNCRL
ncbi:HMGS [Symbiodinium sp. CCMP2592]|nr:HMGS [Symbiodinium sp. CCMP2592]